MRFGRMFFLFLAALLFSACGPVDDNSTDGGDTAQGDASQGGSTVELACSKISADTTLTDQDASPDYLVPCNRIIAIRAELAVEPGVEIAFANGAGWRVESGGGLEAVGTEQDPVIFRGRDDSAGYWSGIQFGNTNPNNRLEHVHLSGAGSDGDPSINIGYGASEASAAIEHSTIENGAGAGIFMTAYVNLKAFTNNEVRTHDGPPLVVRPWSLGAIEGDNTFEENTPNAIVVAGGDIDEDLTWSPASVPYYVKVVGNRKAQIEVKGSATLTISPGTVIEFGADASLTANGGLAIEGEADNHVTLRGREQNAGHWRGVQILSNNTKNQWTYTDIHHGGSSSHGGIDAVKANIVVWSISGAAQLSLQDVSIEASGGCGIYTYDDDDVVNQTNVTFADLAQEESCQHK